MASSDAQLANAALTERDKMLNGDAYNAMGDPELMRLRLETRQLLQKYNNYPAIEYFQGMQPSEFFGPRERFDILAKLFKMPIEKVEKTLSIEPPFWCDHGFNIEFKGEFYCNFNTTILDCAKVTIGHRGDYYPAEMTDEEFDQISETDLLFPFIAMFAPNVHIYAATHSTDVEERRAGLERAYPVTIGDDCWIGGGVVIVGPCTIGNGTTIAAGAVCRGTYPDNVVLGGVPARVLKVLVPPPILKD